MAGLIIVGLIVATLAVLDLAALAWGVDSRPGVGDTRFSRSTFTL